MASPNTDADTATVDLLREPRLQRHKRPRERSPHSDGPNSSGEGEDPESLVYLLHIVSPSPPDESTRLGAGCGPAKVPFGPAGIRFGRDPGCCDVVLPAASVSRLHTVLSVVGEDVCVHDKSHNGTFINGRLLGRGRCAVLRDRDLISFVNPLLPEANSFSYTLELPRALRLATSSSDAGSAVGAGGFASLQRAGLTRYTLGPSIGQGSFAVVRLGVDALTGDKVAVKILERRRFFSDVGFTSLHVEIEMMRSMVHPNIVRVLDAFEAPDMVALVMEYVRGGDLFDYVVGRGRNPFTEDEARFLFVQLLEAVIYIHSRRIVHCDLKPENVLVDVLSESPSPSRTDVGPAFPGGPGAAPPPISAISVLDDHQDVAKTVSPFNVRLKLTDFGVAKYYGESREGGHDDEEVSDGISEGAARGGVGTARYAAPEQLCHPPRTSDGRGPSALTPAVDVWALGILLYVLCAGGLPKNPQQDPVVRFSKHLSHLSDACKELIQAMMELEPTKRIRLYEICAHPWLAGVLVSGRDTCAPDDDDAMSATAILSPRFGRSLRPSEMLPSGPTGLASLGSPMTPPSH